MIFRPLRFCEEHNRPLDLLFFLGGEGVTTAVLAAAAALRERVLGLLLKRPALEALVCMVACFLLLRRTIRYGLRICAMCSSHRVSSFHFFISRVIRIVHTVGHWTGNRYSSKKNKIVSNNNQTPLLRYVHSYCSINSTVTTTKYGSTY